MSKETSPDVASMIAPFMGHLTDDQIVYVIEQRARDWDRFKRFCDAVRGAFGSALGQREADPAQARRRAMDAAHEAANDAHNRGPAMPAEADPLIDAGALRLGSIKRASDGAPMMLIPVELAVEIANEPQDGPMHGRARLWRLIEATKPAPSMPRGR